MSKSQALNLNNPHCPLAKPLLAFPTSNKIFFISILHWNPTSSTLISPIFLILHQIFFIFYLHSFSPSYFPPPSPLLPSSSVIPAPPSTELPSAPLLLRRHVSTRKNSEKNREEEGLNMRVGKRRKGLGLNYFFLIIFCWRFVSFLPKSVCFEGISLSGTHQL